MLCPLLCLCNTMNTYCYRFSEKFYITKVLLKVTCMNLSAIFFFKKKKVGVVVDVLLFYHL